WHYLSGSGGNEAIRQGNSVVWIFGNNLLMSGMQSLLVGPLPPGKDLAAHPMVVSGWFGLLVTMLNLIPIGQLDGGHLSHAALGKWAIGLGKLMALLMLGLCIFFSAGWLLWLVITAKLIGFKHPPVLEPALALTPARKWTCFACLVGLIVCVM